MREYETIFMTRPDGNESQTKQLLERVDTVITRHGGTILQKKDWGKKDLAYKVHSYNQGFYYYYDYTGDSDVVNALERTLRLHELPMKFLTVKLSDKVDVEARKKELKKLEEAAKVAPEEEVIEKPDKSASEEVRDA